MEEETHRIKIHYVGYSARHDEWIRKSEVRYKPVRDSHRTDQNAAESPGSTNAAFLVFSTLGCCIKQKLVPSGAREDPAVRIQLPCTKESFQIIKQRGRRLGKSLSRDTYTLRNYNDLDDLLGESWHLRISNTNGDFSYVIIETIRFYMLHPRSLMDFEAQGETIDDLKFTPFYTEQPTALVFQFVKKDGNKRELVSFINS